MKATALLTDALDTTVETRTFRFDPLYGGGPAYIDGFDAPTYVDLSTLAIDPAPKALIDHDFEAVVGQLINIENDGRRICCDARVGGTKRAREVIEWAENVADWVPSIGVYRIDEKNVEYVAQGETSTVNEREVVGPAWIVRGGTLCEGSFVACGGDGEASAVLLRFQSKGKVMKKVKTRKALAEIEEGAVEEVPTEEIEQVVEEVVTENADVIAEAAAEEAVEAAAEEHADEIVQDLVADAVEEAADAIAEDVPQEVIDEVVEEVVDEIEGGGEVDETDEVATARYASKRAARLLKAKMARRSRATSVSEKRRIAALSALAVGGDAKTREVVAAAIEDGWTVKRATRVLAAGRRRQKTLAALVNPGRGAARAGALRKQDILCASLAQTLGMSPARIQAAFKFDQRVIDAAQSKEYRNATLRTIVAESNNSFNPGSFGVNTSMLSAWNECRDNCRRARLGAVRANAGFSTISATDVFTLVLQAFLEPSQETAPRVYSEITRANMLADFNTVSSYLPTLQGRLREISETGAIQNISFTTEKFDRSTKANGINFTIPEMVIINDQIDVFAELMRQFETLADDCVEHDVAEMFWKVIDGDAKDGDGNALVSATRGNYISSSSLDESGLGAALVALNSFATKNGVPLSADGSVLLTGSKLGPTAMKLWAQEYVDFANGTATPNIYRGRFQPLIWTYLDKAHARAKKDDGSTASLLQGEKTWALLRNPQTRPVVCVNKLIGYESPQIRQFDYDPAVWGVTYQLIYPYSVSAQYADGIIVSTNS